MATFSSRIDLAYVLGAIGPKAHQTLHLMREIRNDFAHNPSLIDFSKESIVAKCQTLDYGVLDKTAPTRTRFVNAAFGLIGYVLATTEKIAKPAVAQDYGWSEAHQKTLEAFVKELKETGTLSIFKMEPPQ